VAENCTVFVPLEILCSSLFFLRCALWLCNKQALDLCRNEQHFNVQFCLVVKKPALPVYVSDAALHLSQEIMRI
jgi:hypothetical protein